MGEESVVYVPTMGFLFGRENERCPAVCDSPVDLESIVLSKISQTQASTARFQGYVES